MKGNGMPKRKPKLKPWSPRKTLPGDSIIRMVVDGREWLIPVSNKATLEWRVPEPRSRETACDGD